MYLSFPLVTIFAMKEKEPFHEIAKGTLYCGTHEEIGSFKFIPEDDPAIEIMCIVLRKSSIIGPNCRAVQKINALTNTSYKDWKI